MTISAFSLTMLSNGDRPVAKYYLHQWVNTATTMVYYKVKRLASERGHYFVIVVWLSDFRAGSVSTYENLPAFSCFMIIFKNLVFHGRIGGWKDLECEL
ncbi:hypothetical protein Moror_15538 [Moniliophthora roreri MCA 2997]|uniref:Uncharacterized protein n=2 Tax=Moniliophthora roreri TaxID=221103 RepID=V2WKG8_MONRO|nr:hypothetical protein Moror_15538 [Moniliophthora roreri MCA 2997]